MLSPKMNLQLIQVGLFSHQLPSKVRLKISVVKQQQQQNSEVSILQIYMATFFTCLPRSPAAPFVPSSPGSPYDFKSDIQVKQMHRNVA